jgi:ferritin-like metal-binding protein YciE
MDTLFTPTRTQKLANLQKKQTSALTMFTKTLNDLANVNDAIENEVTETETQIKELTKFNEDLNKQRDANAKIMTKIKVIVED